MVKYGILKKSKSIAPFWRVDRSDFKLQNTTPGRRLYGKKTLFYTVLMIKSHFWHFQALSNGQIWYIKKKQVYSSILKGWQIWLQIVKHNPWKEVVWEKALFYTVLMIKRHFWHFQALSNGQIWYIKTIKSITPFWRFDRSDFKL